MISQTLCTIVIVASLVFGTQANSIPSLHRRLTGQTIAFACYGGGGDCQCPIDNTGDSGVLINVYPGYQCAYPNGACTWDDKVCCSIASVGLILKFCSLIIVYFRSRPVLFRIPYRQTALPLLPAALPVAASVSMIAMATPVSLSINSLVTSALTRRVLVPGTLYVRFQHHRTCVTDNKSSQAGDLQNTAQTNCPDHQICTQSGVDA